MGGGEGDNHINGLSSWKKKKKKRRRSKGGEEGLGFEDLGLKWTGEEISQLEISR